MNDTTEESGPSGLAVAFAAVMIGTMLLIEMSIPVAAIVFVLWVGGCIG